MKVDLERESFTVDSAETGDCLHDSPEQPQTLTLYLTDGRKIVVRARFDYGCGGAYLDIES